MGVCARGWGVGYMDGQMGGWMDGWGAGRVDGGMGGWVGGWVGGITDGSMNGQPQHPPDDPDGQPGGPALDLSVPLPLRIQSQHVLRMVSWSWPCLPRSFLLGRGLPPLHGSAFLLALCLPTPPHLLPKWPPHCTVSLLKIPRCLRAVSGAAQTLYNRTPSPLSPLLPHAHPAQTTW